MQEDEHKEDVWSVINCGGAREEYTFCWSFLGLGEGAFISGIVFLMQTKSTPGKRRAEWIRRGQSSYTHKRGEHIMISVVVHLKLQNLKLDQSYFLSFASRSPRKHFFGCTNVMMCQRKYGKCILCVGGTGKRTVNGIAEFPSSSLFLSLYLDHVYSRCQSVKEEFFLL